MQALRSTAGAPRPALSSSSSARRGSALVVRVKPSKAADYRALSEAELITGAAALKAEYTKLQYLKRAQGKVINPETLQDQADKSGAPKAYEFKHVRQQMAQMLTVLREKQAADGLDRKAARKLKREASVGAGMGGR